MTKCDHVLVNTGELEEGKYKYRCSCPGCTYETSLARADENVCSQLKSESCTPPEDEPKQAGDKTEAQKNQSDYHKRRYQLLKSGQWKVKS
jgi:hypothetical protein